MDIKRLIQKYGKYIKAVGFSGHHRGASIDNATVVLGATWIERHFTFDRSAKGTDQAASLEERGLVTLVTTIRKLQRVIGKERKQVLDIETEVAKKLRYWETT